MTRFSCLTSKSKTNFYLGLGPRRRALFTPGADEFLGPPHALAAQMRLHASRKVPPKPTRKLAGPGLVTIGRGNSPRGGGILTGHSA